MTSKFMTTLRFMAFSFLFAAILLSLAPATMGRDTIDIRQPTTTAAGRPATCATTHTVSKIALTVSNFGTLGSFYLHAARWTIDCFTGDRAPSCEYPRHSGAEYLFGGAIWLGGILRGDTLVSTGSDGWGIGPKHVWDAHQVWEHRGMEWAPDEYPFGEIKRGTTLNPLADEFRDAVSEEDITCIYTDTFPNGHRGNVWDLFEGRSHQPLRVEIKQTSYAWSYPYAESMILFRLDIKNIGEDLITGAHLGLLIDGDVYGVGNRPSGAEDDITGFLSQVTSRYQGCDFSDTVNVAWIADNDGDFIKANPATAVIGTRILQAPNLRHETPSYNWWTSSNIPYYDFGPRKHGTLEKPFRDFGTGGLGTPEGDRNKYAMMANGEVDYDQIRTVRVYPDGEWLYPGWWRGSRFYKGRDIRYLHSVGPFNLIPNYTATITFAFLASENLHHSQQNFRDYLQGGGYDPEAFYDGMNFDEFGKKALWASWVYDNPGIDTDGDGYRGKFRLCCLDSVIADVDTNGNTHDTVWINDVCDTVCYAGDGQPDYIAATAPPAPKIWVEGYTGYVKIRWNGLSSETTPDMFTRELDFDGYRVYLGRDDRSQSFTLMASYDRENYVKYVFNTRLGFFEPRDEPMSREEIICLYGDSCNDPDFDPRLYDRTTPLWVDDSLIYFGAQDYNQSEFGITTPILKSYPDAPRPPWLYPSAVPDSHREVYLTDDGYFKYYEYEYLIDNLLPTVPYFVNISAFDVGSPHAGLDALESPRHINAIEVYPQPRHEEVIQEDLDVYVYPNPYRIDGGYLDQGYEGRNARFYIPERLRLVHFANLPPQCWIRVFSIDGDLIRELRHDKDPSDPTSTHATWDMISRNTQAIASGIYYWVIEEDGGRTQMGKLVIIK